ncbi:Sulfotransferase family cytosolic 1B member 1 [Holothuria leucospilota]|uniref:Sulfotransferase family cytosolic 1B member 1 n=1 Tax=Holothuria leucospilota TaxID=206669 RepID=A0A9Q1BYG3_HOLLE|nr:Sulfotransferase family cytosolic 1B member 1 [Holothuria leucospilota]
MEDKLPDFLKKSLMPIITEAFEYDQVWYPTTVVPDTLDKLKTFEVREDDLILASYPKSGKIVYVTREPKDCCASNYRFLNSHPAESSEVPWEMFFNNFISEKVLVCLIIETYRLVFLPALFLSVRFGNWCDHALGYWKHRMGGHVFFVTYEEMKQDVRSVTRRLAKFLGKNISSDVVERIVEQSSFDGMRRTYAQIDEETSNGKMFTRFFGVIPHLQQGKGRMFTNYLKEKKTKNFISYFSC